MKSQQSFYIYGRKPILDYLTHHPEDLIRVFFAEQVKKNEPVIAAIQETARKHRIPFATITDKKLKIHVGDVNDQGVIALIKQPRYQEFYPWLQSLDKEQPHLVLLLDHVQDTHNFGAILRTAAGLGVSGVIVAKDSQAPMNATVMKTSAGGALYVPIIRVSNLNDTVDKLKAEHFWSVALDMPQSDREHLWNHDFDRHTVAIVGSEGQGISEKLRERADFVAGIPLNDELESYNVSVASSLMIYEWSRQHRK